jgi:geranylgeranyl diphosphate synthase type I
VELNEQSPNYMNNFRNSDFLISDIKDKAAKISDFIFKDSNYPLIFKNLYEASFYYLKKGGKKIRPYLVIKSAELFGCHENFALPTAATIEMIHNFSLIHDDIMDNSDFRRNVPSVHKKYGIDYAVLAGDFLLIYALDFLVEKNKSLNISDEKILKINKKILETLKEICEGQALDSDFSRNFDLPSKQDYFLMISKKTGALFSTSCYLGGLIADASLKDLEKLSNYGKYLGISFQIVDDILGIFGDSKITGKPVGNDIIEGKKTIPIILGCELCDLKQKEKILSIINSKKAKKEDINFILNTFKEIDLENKLRDLAKEYMELAINEIKEINGDEDVKKYFIELAYFLINRNF